jgi:hypothetical protein
MNRGGFSWNRFLGITKAKRRISRATGIPLTRSGRQRKVGAATGCCVLFFLPVVLVAVTVVLVKII